MSQSLTAEMAFLGAVLIDPRVMRECRHIQPSHFSLTAHGEIYRAARKCVKSGAIDLVLMAEELVDSTELEAVGGPQYLQQLIESCPSSQSAPHYARIVFEHALRRHLGVVCQRVMHESKADLGKAMATGMKELKAASEAYRRVVGGGA